MLCSNCREASLICDDRRCTTERLSYRCLSCGHRETEKRNNPGILDFPAPAYRHLTAEEFVSGGWALRPETVWTEGYTLHHDENGAAIYRLMQVLSVEIGPDNYHWITFDFETSEICQTTCWSFGPSLYIFVDEDTTFPN